MAVLHLFLCSNPKRVGCNRFCLDWAQESQTKTKLLTLDPTRLNKLSWDLYGSLRLLRIQLVDIKNQANATCPVADTEHHCLSNTNLMILACV